MVIITTCVARGDDPGRLCAHGKAGRCLAKLRHTDHDVLHPPRVRHSRVAKRLQAPVAVIRPRPHVDASWLLQVFTLRLFWYRDPGV